MSVGCPLKSGSEAEPVWGGGLRHETAGVDAGNSCDRNCERKWSSVEVRSRREGEGGGEGRGTQVETEMFNNQGVCSDPQ